VAASPGPGLKRTKIMQDTVVKYVRTCHYVDELVGEGLLSFNPVNHRYTITHKGREYLSMSHELSNYIMPLHDMIAKYQKFFPDAIVQNR